jgi:hypothetical protein
VCVAWCRVPGAGCPGAGCQVSPHPRPLSHSGGRGELRFKLWARVLNVGDFGDFCVRCAFERVLSALVRVHVVRLGAGECEAAVAGAHGARVARAGWERGGAGGAYVAP